MDSWLHALIELLPAGPTYLALLFFIAFFEGIPFLGLIVPGSTLAVLAGFLVIHGKGTLVALILSHCCGALLGDLFSYWLGLRYGAQLIRTRGFRKYRLVVKRSERFFVDHGGKSVIFARFLGPIRGITPFIAGSSKMPGRSFSFYALLSAILWGISYPGLGYLGGQSWQQAQSLTVRFGILVIVILIVTIVQHWLRKKVKRQ